jgi:hypothetical protein
MSFVPPCPRCKTALTGITGTGQGFCGGCATPLEFLIAPPAAARSRPIAQAVRAAEGDAACFFHATNTAASECGGCGRYLCTVCEVAQPGGGVLCPACIAAGRKAKTPDKANEIPAYDNLAMLLAVVPMIFMFYLTIVTAPLVLGLVIYGWRKPRSLVRGQTARFVAATIIASIQIGAWIAFGVTLWFNK